MLTYSPLQLSGVRPDHGQTLVCRVNRQHRTHLSKVNPAAVLEPWTQIRQSVRLNLNRFIKGQCEDQTWRLPVAEKIFRLRSWSIWATSTQQSRRPEVQQLVWIQHHWEDLTCWTDWSYHISQSELHHHPPTPPPNYTDHKTLVHSLPTLNTSELN